MKNNFIKAFGIITSLIIIYNGLLLSFRLFNDGNFIYSMLAIINIFAITLVMYYSKFLTTIKFNQKQK